MIKGEHEMADEAFRSLDMTGKTIIVTGAGSGLGRGTARLLAARGAAVAVADINDDGGGETVEQIAKEGGQAVFIHADISDEENVKELVARTVETFGGLSGAFNNAGAESGASLHETSTADWNRQVGVNLTGTFFCLKYEIAYLLEHGGGSLVNTSSLAGFKAVPNLAAYVASKHGVVGLTRAASMDYAGRGIRVNVILPGTIQTPMLDDALRDEVLKKALEDATPIGHVGQIADIAEQAAWLLSDASKYTTGSQFFVDGGSNGV
jgi:NAD(P)-dependent dehydrogenase (short-subunit alcohol dehydrogenase family)